MPTNNLQPQFLHNISKPILRILRILPMLMIMSMLQSSTNSLYIKSTQPVCCEYVHAFMLDNCSFISIISNVRTRPQRWVISEKEGIFNTTGYNRSNFQIKIVDASWQFFYLGAWSNKIDQIGYIALDADKNKFAQMIKIDTNSSYRFTLMSDITFMCYVNKRSILIIDNEYPYRIFNGSIKNNTWSQVYSYPPILLTPTQKIICNKYSNCIWMMKNNMFVGYPMLSQPVFMKFKDEEINCFVFATVNGTNFLYTGTHSGLVYQWEQIGLYEYRPIRMLANLHSRPIHNMVVIRNQSLFIQSLDFKKQIIHLPTSQVHDSLSFKFEYAANMTVGCEENGTYPPFLFGYSLIAYDPINDNGYNGAYIPVPTACPIGFQCNSFHKMKCFSYSSSIQHTPGLFGTVIEYECIIDNSVIEMDPSLVPPIPNITGCMRYTKRSDPVCIECASGYELVYLNGTSYNNQFQLTTCRTNSSNTNTNQNVTNNNTGYNESRNSSSIYNTTNNSTNSSYNDNDSTVTNNTTPVIVAEDVRISAAGPANRLSETAQNIVSTISSSIQATITPFYYIKNILQLTLFAFTIHGLLNLWILASLYYFLPLGTHFLKDVLLMMWKIYNTSALALFNIQPPILPRLNNAQSDMIYGDITISNDFLEFTFDPFVMFSIALVNFVAFYYLRKLLKKICTTERKFKFSWLKFQMFESVSDIIIELLPVLFLPCANFVFNPHFGDYYQRINLLLFSGMAGVGVIFPFFYFSKLVKDKNSSQKTQKLQKSIKNKNIENKARLKPKCLKQKRKHKHTMKQKKAKKIRRSSNNLTDTAVHTTKTSSIRKSFIFTKCKEIDDFLNCILTLSIPITVTMANINIFFAANAIIIFYGLVNSMLMTKKKFSIFFYWLYFLAYHTCFVIMNLYVQEDGSQSDIYVYASFSALIIVVVSLLHQIVKILYNGIKFIKGACKSYKNKNKVINLQQQNIGSQEIKKLSKPKNNDKRYEKMSFKQYMQDKQMQQKMKMAQININKNTNTNNNSFRNITDGASENTKYSNLSQSTNGYFFKQDLSAFASEIMPLTTTMAAVVQSRREKRKSKLRKERLDRRFNANGMKVGRCNEQRSKENAYEIVSEKSSKELWETAKMQ